MTIWPVLDAEKLKCPRCGTKGVVTYLVARTSTEPFTDRMIPSTIECPSCDWEAECAR